MRNTTLTDQEILCPSSRPQLKDSKVFGLVNGTVEKPRITYLKSSQPVTDELIALCSPVTPTEVFRIATPCISNGCKHFDGVNCGLASQVVEQLAIVDEKLPSCSIRQDCRWYQQEGKAACLRCSQIVTDNYSPNEPIHKVATPTGR